MQGIRMRVLAVDCEKGRAHVVFEGHDKRCNPFYHPLELGLEQLTGLVDQLDEVRVTLHPATRTELPEPIPEKVAGGKGLERIPNQDDVPGSFMQL